MPDFVRVARFADIPHRRGRRVSVRGCTIALFKLLTFEVKRESA
jgi:hypothetical protein